MNKQFEVHMLNEASKTKSVFIAGVFDKLLDALKFVCPEGRELAIVRTKLEEACFFAKKAMAVQEANQEKSDAIEIGKLPKDN